MKARASSNANPQRLYVGVDVAKADFAAATVWREQVEYLGKQPNTEMDCRAFVAHIGEQQQTCGAESVHLLIEPTGGLEAEMVEAAHHCGWLVTVVNLKTVHHWAQAHGQRAKTDRQDALMLAQYGADENPAPPRPLDEEVAELDSLLSRRADLEQLLRSERNRFGQLRRRSAPAVGQSLERSIKALEQELTAIDAAIKQLQSEQESLNRQLEQLRSIPSIGVKIAPYLLVQLHRFFAKTNGRGTARQFVAFLGLDPTPHQSGKTQQRATISRQGNAGMRSMLFFGALGGVSGHNPLADFYTSLLARNKPKKLALVACERKAATWAWAIFSQGTFFDPALVAKA